VNSDGADFGERLRGMSATAASPDGQIRATISGDLSLRITFSRGTFEWYDERGLSRQLASLGINTWVAWERERREIYRRSQSLTVEEAEQERRSSDDSRRDNFAADLRELECETVSPSAVLRIRTIGMINWQVEIEPGSLQQFRERDFVNEITGAFAGLMQDRERKLILLKAEHFDLGIPRSWLDRVR
jgi:hypothetical protein